MPAFPDLDALRAWLEKRRIALRRQTGRGGLRDGAPFAEPPDGFRRLRA